MKSYIYWNFILGVFGLLLWFWIFCLCMVFLNFEMLVIEWVSMGFIELFKMFGLFIGIDLWIGKVEILVVDFGFFVIFVVCLVEVMGFWSIFFVIFVGEDFVVFILLFVFDNIFVERFDFCLLVNENLYFFVIIFFWFIKFWWLCNFIDEFDLRYFFLFRCVVLCGKFELRSLLWLFDIVVKLVDEFDKLIDKMVLFLNLFVFEKVLDVLFIVRLVEMVVFKYIFVLIFCLVNIFFLK